MNIYSAIKKWPRMSIWRTISVWLSRPGAAGAGRIFSGFAVAVVALAVAGAGFESAARNKPGLFDTSDAALPDWADLDAPAMRRILLAADTGEVRFPFRAGTKPQTLTLVWADGRKTELKLTAAAGVFKQASTARGAAPEDTVERSLPDACLKISGAGLKLDYFVRPNPHFYHASEQAKQWHAWNTSPGASQHEFM